MNCDNEYGDGDDNMVVMDENDECDNVTWPGIQQEEFHLPFWNLCDMVAVVEI